MVEKSCIRVKPSSHSENTKQNKSPNQNEQKSALSSTPACWIRGEVVVPAAEITWKRPWDGLQPGPASCGDPDQESDQGLQGALILWTPMNTFSPAVATRWREMFPGVKAPPAETLL